MSTGIIPGRMIDKATTSEAEAGTSEEKVMCPATTKQAVLAHSPFAAKLIHVQHKTGAAGGDLNSGAWRTRVLDTVITNEIPGASLLSNGVVLPAGTYHAEGFAIGFDVDEHQVKLEDVTHTVDLLLGSTADANANYAACSQSTVRGRFTLSAEATVKLKHQCETTRATNGMGPGISWGQTVHAELLIWKLDG